MRLKVYEGGFQVWLSAHDTARWAWKPGARWPCSTLEGHRVFVEFDGNGLCDLRIDGKRPEHVDGNELNAIVEDHVRPRLPADHDSHIFFDNTHLGVRMGG